jgi:hypothetical protein
LSRPHSSRLSEQGTRGMHRLRKAVHNCSHSLRSLQLTEMSSDVCSLCETPLLTTSGAERGPSQIPDDVKLYCSSVHHFHWACLLEHYATSEADRTRCPAPGCGLSILDSRGRFLVDVTNEGGFTEGFDFGAELVSRPC